MKSNELRIGNYLNFKNTPIKVSSIGDYINGYYIDRYEPIILNDDWLNKLCLNLRITDKGDGIKQRFWHTPHFGRHNEHYLELQIADENSLKSDFLWLNWNIGGGNDFVYLPKKVKYVHELQNLFYVLSGVELRCA